KGPRAPSRARSQRAPRCWRLARNVERVSERVCIARREPHRARFDDFSHLPWQAQLSFKEMFQGRRLLESDGRLLESDKAPFPRNKALVIPLNPLGLLEP